MADRDGTADDVLGAVKSRANELAALDATAARERRLPDGAVVLLREAGVYRLAAPADRGGIDATPVGMLDVIEAVAEASGAAAWNVATHLALGLPAKGLPAEGLDEVFAAPGRVFAGSVAASGSAKAKAEADPGGGIRVTGAWRFASGCGEADWLSATCTVDGSRRAASTTFFVPAADARIVQTWDTIGLAGTGSDDWHLDDVFVPAHRTVAAIHAVTKWPGTTRAFPIPWLGAVHFSAVATGLARRAIAALVELAATKVPTGIDASLRTRPRVQHAVGRATAMVEAARSHRTRTVVELWERSARHEPVTLEATAAIRLAGIHAVECAVEATRLAFSCGGTSVIGADSPVANALRDVEVIAQNVTVAPDGYAAAGQVLLGGPDGAPAHPLAAFGLF